MKCFGLKIIFFIYCLQVCEAPLPMVPILVSGMYFTAGQILGKTLPNPATANFRETMSAIKDISTKVDQIQTNIMNHLKRMSEYQRHIPLITNYDGQKTKLLGKLQMLDNMNMTAEHGEGRIKNFLKDVTGSDADSLPQLAYHMHTYLSKQEWQLLNFMFKEAKSMKSNKGNLTEHQFAYDLFTSILLIELRVAMAFAVEWKILNEKTRFNHTDEYDTFLKVADERMNEYKQKFSELLLTTDTKLWLDESSKHTKFYTLYMHDQYFFIKFSSIVFPWYRFSRTCDNENRDSFAEDGGISKQKPCKAIADCKHVFATKFPFKGLPDRSMYGDEYDYNDYHQQLCLNNDNGHQRYRHGNDHQRYLHFSRALNEHVYVEVGLNTCYFDDTYFDFVTPSDHDICVCRCTKNPPYKNKIYINRDKMLADPGYVITGLRLIRPKNIIFLSIQQSKLLPDGQVDSNDTKWLDSASSSISDSNIFSVDSSTVVELYKIHASQSMDKPLLLTGLAFARDRNRLRLEAHFTAVNFTGGYLLPDLYADWISSPHPTCTPKKMTGEVPIRFTDNKPYLRDICIQFIQSKLEDDFGNSAMPYFDGRDVAFPRAMAGAAMFIRGKPGSGGFIAFEFYEYNKALTTTW